MAKNPPSTKQTISPKEDAPPTSEPSTMEIDDGNNVNQTPTTGVEQEPSIASVKEKTNDTKAGLDETKADGNEEREEGNVAQTQDDVSTKDSTGSAFSEKEIFEMRQTHPAEAFRLLRRLSTSSINLATSSSTSSLTSISQETTEKLLQELKVKVLEGDILAEIRENPETCSAVKELLKKLRKLGPSEELLAFIMNFGSILDTLANEVTHQTVALKQKEHEQQLHQTELESLKATETEIDNLEAQKANNTKAIADLDAKIQRYQDEIKELQLKLESAEREMKLLQESMVDPESKLRAEALKGLEHLDKVNQQKATIAQLDEELSQLEISISAGTKIFNRLKENLRNIQ